MKKRNLFKKKKIFFIMTLLALFAVGCTFFDNDGSGFTNKRNEDSEELEDDGDEKENEAVKKDETSPTPTVYVPRPTQVPPATATPIPTSTPIAAETPIPIATATPTATNTPTSTPTETPVPTATHTPTPTPDPQMVADAKQALSEVIDPFLYSAVLVDTSIELDDIGFLGYRLFDSIDTPLEPYVLVSKENFMLFYIKDGVLELLTKYPLDLEEDDKRDEVATISVGEAYGVLCGYDKELLKLARDVAEYDVDYNEYTTGVGNYECYSFILLENNKNRGEFYVSTDGTKVFAYDFENDAFIEILRN